MEDEVNSELVGGRLQNRGARFRAGSWDGLGRRAHQRFEVKVEIDGEFKLVLAKLVKRGPHVSLQI